MDFVRRWMAQIQVQLGQTSLTTKMLLGMCVCVFIGVLTLVAVTTSRPDMEPLFSQPLPPAQHSDVLGFIRQREYDYKVDAGNILVPSSEKYAILAALNARQIIPEDHGGGFAELLERQSWWISNAQLHQAYNIALQNELADAIRRTRNVRDAKVIISHTDKAGFGQPKRRATAQVTVEMSGGAMTQKLVDAIAGQVSGAVGGMTPEDVVIVDAGEGRAWKVRKNQDMMIGDYWEMVQTQEQLYRVKIADALKYIDDVIVAVNVELDPKRSDISKTSYSKDDSVALPIHESRRSSNSRDEKSGGEPGAASNVSATIAGSTSSGRSEETEESETDFDAHAGVVHEKTFDPGGQPTRVSASISVPRSYFVKLFKIGQADGSPEPTDAVLQPIIDEALPRIQAKVQNIIAAKQPGRVVVDTYYDDGVAVAAAQAAAAAAGAPSGGSGVIAMLTTSGNMVKHISLGLLAAVSLFMMFLMMRKATQPPKLPSAAELAGIPPALQSDEEVIGEAMEMDAALTGIELDEGSIRNRKLAEQVGEMVRNDPAEAAALVGRWIHNGE